MIDKTLFYLNLGQMIRNVRKDNNYTLEHLSIASGLDVGKATLSEIENGKQGLSIYQLYLISKALNLSVGDLIKDAAKKSENTIDNSKNLLTDSEKDNIVKNL